MGAAADKGEPSRAEAAEWLLRLQAAPEDLALRQDFETWLAGDESRPRAWRSVQRVWGLSGGLPAPPEDTGAVAPPPRARIKGWRVLGVALAALAAFYLAPIIALQWEADYTTSVGELRDVTLEDGSLIHLDAGSAIAVNYGATRREVSLLAGRAFFEVVPGADRPFVVRADDVTVTVTGTAFEVRAAADGLAVSVRSGTVEVEADRDGRPARRLTAGERLAIDRHSRKVEQARIAPEDVASWREGRLVVDGVSLAEVVEELGRHHRGFIVIRDPALAARRVTGVFDLRHPVDALDAIARSQRASITQITSHLLLLAPAPGS
ncbi:FecR family protein [Reyranella sp.]|uniref:FecR family protein n=1 Tax=Reyranella sp. TaxID=1929291 RepID=UPI003D0CBB60